MGMGRRLWIGSPFPNGHMIRLATHRTTSLDELANSPLNGAELHYNAEDENSASKMSDFASAKTFVDIIDKNSAEKATSLDRYRMSACPNEILPVDV
jgi:hypothetical protein